MGGENVEEYTIRNLSFSYPGQEEPALRGLDLTVRAGEFLTLCGPSGCGKSTLLRQLKPVLAPHGTRTGEILFEGAPLDGLDLRVQSQKIGFVRQDPEGQIVTDKVWHELAFGMESLGYDTPAIRRRVAEMASFFGIQTWFYKNVAELSGGQKQLLSLASVMAMQPSVLILDEPTSQLDPIAASDFLAMLGRINRELGTTIILTEHRLEEAFPLSSRVAVMDRGQILCAGTAAEVGMMLRGRGHSMFSAMPAAMRIWAAVESGAPCPVTVREGRDWLAGFAAQRHLNPLPAGTDHRYPGEPVIQADELWFRYEEEQPDVIKGLSLTVKKGELLAVLGGNGTGKTTMLKLLSGLYSPYRGELKVTGRVGALPQDPQALFVKKTVREDLCELLRGSREEQDAQVAYAAAVCRLEGVLDRHPYDLSGGEQQRAALAKVLLLQPDILLLDEPTKGLDAGFKQTMGEILGTLLARGVTVLMVSHDIEFCARYAHRCALFFDGNIVTEAPPRSFFSGNSFYTTAADRMARGLIAGAVTAEDVIAVCGGQLPPQTELPGGTVPLPRPRSSVEAPVPQETAKWRKAAAVLSGAAALFFLLRALSVTDLTSIGRADGASFGLYVGFLLSLFVFALSAARRTDRPMDRVQVPKGERKLSRRTAAAAGAVLLLIPLTLFVGVCYLDGKKYYFISLLIVLEAMLPFFLTFEARRPQARELVVIAVLCAIGVAGRAAFFMLPQFKPVMAVAIIAGVALGGETGFLVGSVTMLVSNIMFAQGPWTPWQMFCMGIIGHLAGILYQKGLLRRTRGSLCVYGALSAIVIYGGIMDPVSALMWSSGLNWKILLTYYVSGFPMNCIHAAATWLFLWFAAEPMLEKLERVKTKYGLLT